MKKLILAVTTMMVISFITPTVYACNRNVRNVRVVRSNIVQQVFVPNFITSTVLVPHSNFVNLEQVVIFDPIVTQNFVRRRIVRNFVRRPIVQQQVIIERNVVRNRGLRLRDFLPIRAATRAVQAIRGTRRSTREVNIVRQRSLVF